MKNNERDERKTRKALVPLATLAVAAAVAVGSGATWTTSSTNHVSITSGNLLNENLDDGATMTVGQLKPGVTKSAKLTIDEGDDNDVDADLKLVASNVSSGFTAGDLLIRIKAENKVDTGYFNFETLNSTNGTIDLGTLEDEFGTQTVEIFVSMPTTAGNGAQGKDATADFQFVTTATTDPTTNTTVNFS